MKLKRRIQKECTVVPMMLKGYSRAMCNSWYKATRSDLRKYRGMYSEDTIKAMHKKGYLCRSISRYDLLNNPDCGYVTDMEYMNMSPYNSSMSKWISDILTTTRVLAPYGRHFRRIYFSVIRRDAKPLFLRVGRENREYTLDDVIDLLREKGRLELRPAYWQSKSPRYDMHYVNNRVQINGKYYTKNELNKLFGGMYTNYVIADHVSLYYSFTSVLTIDHSLELWIANDTENGTAILSAMMNFYWTDSKTQKRVHHIMPVNLETGAFTAPQGELTVPGWKGVRARILEIAREMKMLSYFSVSIALQENQPFPFLHFSITPVLPGVAFHQELNEYLKPGPRP